jgi:uncharacterized protein YaaN involved in tellurite resistance
MSNQIKCRILKKYKDTSTVIFLAMDALKKVEAKPDDIGEYMSKIVGRSKSEIFEITKKTLEDFGIIVC